MFLARSIPQMRTALGVLVLGMAQSAFAAVRTCDAPPVTTAMVNSCIATYGTPVNAATNDTLVVQLTKGIKYIGAQVVIDGKKNVFLLGDTVALPAAATLPTINYQDIVHTNSDTGRIGQKAIYWEFNGALLVNESRNILIQGVGIDGSSDPALATGKIFAFCGTYSTTSCVDIKGNIGLNIRNSYGVTFRGGSVWNTWYGVAIQGRNLGGAFSYPTPLDPPSQVNATLPTSRAGLYGRHLIERSRFFDNTWGTLFEYDWDLGSIIRNNLYYNNYLRDYGKFPGYITGLLAADNRLNTLGQTKSLRYNIVGGALFMNGVALTPYRIHNNTFYKNGVVVGAYYMAGTQHLFYNNIVGEPYQYHSTATVSDQMTNADNNYTQTERATEMLQFYSEHQRSNLVMPQDGPPKSTTAAIDLWGQNPNFRLFRMKMNRSWQQPTYLPPAPGPGGTNWRDGRNWSNQTNEQDSLSMTWVPQVTAAPISTLSDSGGYVQYIRHNMYAATFADPYDKDAGTATYGLPYMPLNIRRNLTDPKVFRDVLGFNLRWTNTLPLVLSTTSTGFGRPLASAASTRLLVGKGWPVYDGQAAKPMDIGALATGTTAAWAVPDVRLTLQDTLIELMQGDTIGFRMDVSATGFASSDIQTLKVAKAKFYYDVPVADTTFNAGGSGNDTTRWNSILSAKPWPIADSAINYNLWNIDDTLTAGKLRPDHFFVGKLSKGPLPDSVYFARAEVVLEATLKDGRVVYSNPGVFMYSRPRFLLDVVLRSENGQELPLDADGFSRQVLAGQKVIMSVTPKLDVSKLPTGVNSFRDLQMGQTSLMGRDTANSSLERDSSASDDWQKIRPNQVLQALLGKTEIAVDTLRFTEAGLVGSLTLRALFAGIQSQNFLQGSSKRIRVVASSIYQATIDSIFIGDSLLATPKSTLKRALDLLVGGPGQRDTLLKTMVGTRLDSSVNLSGFGNGISGRIRLVLQVRDQFGNPVTDSVAAGLRVKLQATSNATRFANGLGAQVGEVPSILIPGSGIRSFDMNGRVVFDSISVGALSRSGVIFPFRSAVVRDTVGFPEIGAGTNRPGIPDTTWIQTAPPLFSLQVTDTLGVAKAATVGLVGDLVPVRLKASALGKGTKITATLSLTADPSLVYYASPDGTTPITSVGVLNDSLSPIVWVRATDTTSAGTFGAGVTVGGESAASQVIGNVFTFPRLRQASFHDQNCDGRVDSIVLRFLDPVRFRPLGAGAFADSIDAKFPGQLLTPSALGAAPRTIRISDTVVTLAWNPAAMAAASLAANRLVLANPLGGSRMVLTPALLVDKAPPLAISGTVQQSWMGQFPVDVVTVRFSETIDTTRHIAGSFFPFNVKRAGAIVRLDTLTVANKVATVAPGIYSWVLVGRIGAILPGDSLIVSDTLIRDFAGNTTGDLCANKPFTTTIAARSIPVDALILDVNGDGNGDRLRVTYLDSLGALPDSFTVRWGTPAETITITRAMLVAAGVKTSDTTFTVDFTGWTGKNVTVDGDVVKAPRTVGPADTAAFFSGAVKVRIRDGIAPVLIHARLSFDQSDAANKVDTVKLTFSEPIAGCPAGSNPSTCLALKSPSAAGRLFPAGSKVIDVVGSVMRLSVPADGPDAIKAGDSTRATPGSQSGVVRDSLVGSVGTKVGDLSPWVIIRADRRPPRLGWFVDANGDGIVEAVIVEYAQASTDTTLPGFRFEWGDTAGSPSTSTGLSWVALDASKTSWKVTLAQPFPYGSTGYPSSAVRNLGTQTGQTSYSFPVRDSVGPVLMPGARLNPASGRYPTDTILVRSSEALDDPLAKVLLSFRDGSVVVPPESVTVSSVERLDGNNWRVVLDPGSKWRPSPGDFVRLSTSGSVTDTTRIGSKPHPAHAWVPLAGRPRSPYDASYLDANGDGRIDTWTANFVTPPSVGTVIRVLDPAGTDSFRTYTVTAADSARTTFSVGITPWGQDVTSLVKPDLGRLYLPGATSTDTARFILRDAVEPVITKARIGYTSDTLGLDTLTIKFSELVSLDPAKIALVWQLASGAGDSAVVGKRGVVWDSVNSTLTFFLKPIPPKDSLGNRPEKGDLLRILDNGVVKDLYGNTPKAVAKWTPVSGTRRVFPPKIGLTNSFIQLGPSSGTPNAGIFDPVIRKPTPGKDGTWNTVTGSGKAGSIAGPYGPSSGGTVLYLSTNIPTKLNMYIYDRIGTYVASGFLELTQKMLDEMHESTSKGSDSTGRLSTVNMVEAGFRWEGKTSSGGYAADGIYVVRIIAFRGPTPEEQAAGVTGIQVTNYLQNIAVKFKKK
jgi:hypothetical protein